MKFALRASEVCSAYEVHLRCMKCALHMIGKFYFMSEGHFIAKQLHIASAILHFSFLKNFHFPLGKSQIRPPPPEKSLMLRIGLFSMKFALRASEVQLRCMKYTSCMKYADAYAGKFYFMSEGHFIAKQLHIASAMLHFSFSKIFHFPPATFP